MKQRSQAGISRKGNRDKLSLRDLRSRLLSMLDQMLGTPVKRPQELLGTMLPSRGQESGHKIGRQPRSSDFVVDLLPVIAELVVASLKNVRGLKVSRAAPRKKKKSN